MMVPPSFIRPCSQSLGCAFSSLARGWRALPEAEVVVGSTFHRTSVELYQRHADRGDGSGRCVTCGQPTPCPARRHAARVIQAAGEDHRWYDRRLPAVQAQAPRVDEAVTATGVRLTPPLAGLDSGAWLPSQPPIHSHPSIDTPGVSGFSVGGHGRRADVPYVEYER